MSSVIRRALIAALVLALPGMARAADLNVAVAANFTQPAKDIAAAFEAKTGTHVALSFGSSGAFFSQIEQGAPFEVFLSADALRPQKLEADGFGVKGTRFTYAKGALVLWSAAPGYIDAHGAVLTKGGFQHLAIADPAAAPYGQAAVETLQKLGLYPALAPKLVKGASIGQTYGFVQTGAAELGFVALSQVIHQTGGSRWIVPASDYAPIEQQAILLTPGKDDPSAKAWLAFLKSPPALKIIASYGYQ
ncbi:molybdate ABC transporter substrate-binding protein [Asticcacaulis sp. EMRT-3]|uniref:molybdate ABC transporter substrate-binding protein n=1 Tax=Asticcacaulis sp. EMRT-3 TaxID=3040349 RepID=UPI0024AFD960|nr:molybdate ABC transporter substrate-binding protein [Asticcacaulis sp. EMRT-3]MDI7775006.1 molybdate ABC transporter substrate-binding protein [Asticcacaulis sp. EMRT-3]